MASCPKELIRNGPTKGMQFTRQQAERLFERYFNKKISWFEVCDSGLNNLLFFIDCENDPQRYVLKICGNVWTKLKTESEVCAIELVHRHTTIPLPQIIGYSSDKSNEFEIEWIVMTRLEGKPLRSSSNDKDIWPQLTIQQQKSIIDQLAQYVSQLHFNIPRRNLIGNYQFNGQIGEHSDRMGPWKNYMDYYNDRLQRQIKTLKEDPLFQPIRDQVLQMIKEFQSLSFPDFKDVENVFTHFDLGVQNLIVNDENEISGIIDWEWAGSYPVCEEYFRSYKPIIYNQQLKEYLYSKLEQFNVQTPNTIPHFNLLEKMSDFLLSIVPWYLTSLVNCDHPTVEKELLVIPDKVKLILQQIKLILK